METSPYDIIFCGGGCAGRSLAVQLLSHPALQDKNILMLDEKAKDTNDRTWCFWDTKPPQFLLNSTSHWEQMEFCHPNGIYKSKLHPYKYYHISGLNFYQETQEILESHPNFTLRQEKVQSVSPQDGVSLVQTDRQVYTASQVFNSIPFLLDTPPAPESVCLQHFYGWFIQSEQPVFEEDTVRLMDFRVEQKGVPRFVYVLPFDKHRALVEFTVFSPTPLPQGEYQGALKSYLERNYQLRSDQYVIEEKEQGRIPMTNHAFPFEVAPEVYNIGTAGGMTKPTTGYTFKTIQQASRLITEALAQGQKPQAQWKGGDRFGFYDRLLIHIIQSEGGQVEKIMQRLFQRNKMSTILKFLDEASHLGEEIPIFLSLPWKPFFKSLYDCYFRPSFRTQDSSAPHVFDYPNPSYNS